MEMEMAMKIEKCIPIPAKNSRGYSGLSGTLRLMDVGDSVLVPNSIKSPGRLASNIAQITNRKFVTRSTQEGWRVWRIA